MRVYTLVLILALKQPPRMVLLFSNLREGQTKPPAHRCSSGDKPENITVYGVPPKKGPFLGEGKCIYIFFNFCPITMIQNINLLYIEYSFRFMKHYACTRAPARAPEFAKIIFLIRNIDWRALQGAHAVVRA